MVTSDAPKTGPPRPEPWFQGPSALLEAIIQSSNDAIITKDLNGIITSWNPAAEHIFGYLPHEMIGQSILRLIPPYLQHQETEILSKLRAGEQIKHFETVRMTKEGREIVVSLTISPIRDNQGKVIGASKILRDVTHQKQLDLARFRLAAIVESADDAIVSKNLDGTITSWNHAAERIFGYTEEEIVGLSILTLIPPELHPEEEVILGKLRRGERVEHYESTRLTKQGERISVSLTISPLRDSSGTIIGASKIARDITDRKLLEQKVIEAEKLAASGKMAATIAHEINNPLEAVLNLIYLANTNAVREDVKGFLDAAEGEVQRLAHIARQTLGFYREQNAAVCVSLSQLVRDALRIYDSKLRTAHVEVRTEFEPAPDIVLRRGEMLQVISNLITNASYAMPNGGSLALAVAKGTRDGREGVRLVVHDSGTGIRAENMKRIFEPFFTTRNATGTGIGLWVAKQFIEGHGGKIEVESSTNANKHGTRFTIWLPLQSPYATVADCDESAHSESSSTGIQTRLE